MEHLLELTAIVADVRGCSSHIETNDPVKTSNFADSSHADYATCRARQNSVFPIEIPSVSEPAVRLHELQAPTVTGEPVKLRGDLFDVTAQYR